VKEVMFNGAEVRIVLKVIFSTESIKKILKKTFKSMSGEEGSCLFSVPLNSPDIFTHDNFSLKFFLKTFSVFSKSCKIISQFYFHNSIFSNIHFHVIEKRHLSKTRVGKNWQ
jgi:hypothetical protein